MLTDCIDGRIGYLGKKLFKIMEQRMVGFAQERQRSVHTHGSNRFPTVFSHRKDAGSHLIIGVSECLLKTVPLLRGELRNPFIGDFQIFQLHQVIIQPFAIRLAGCIGFLELVIVNHLTPPGIHKQHLAGAQTFLYLDFGRLDIQNPHLRGKDQLIILCDQIAGGTQAVAIQNGSHDIPIGKKYGGRAVPWLHHGCIILIKIPF